MLGNTLHGRRVYMAAGLVDAIVVLGCRLRWSVDGRLLGAGGRRVQAAARVWRELGREAPDVKVIASGGRVWGGVVEADALAQELVRAGVPASRVERERLSWSTKENARFVADRLAPAHIAVVTCDWHLGRAVALFHAQGFEVEPVPAVGEPPSLGERLWRWGRERVASRIDGV
jgi:uncharacterized SAM-binding protein YcdF (DUF218 family)